MGKAKVLILSKELDPHADYVVSLLRKLGVGCIRWPTNSYPLQSSFSINVGETGANGHLVIGGAVVDIGEIRSVWNRHPAPFGLASSLTADERRFAQSESRSAFVGLTQVMEAFWVNHPDKNRIAESKVLQLKRAAAIGLEVPATLISNDARDVRRFFEACGGMVAHKVFNSGFFSSDGKVSFTVPLTREHLKQLDRIRHSPGIFQELVSKRSDIRITVIGRRVYATEIHSQDRHESVYDWRAADVSALRHSPHILPAPIEAQCLALMDDFGLVYGAIDMILTPEGRYVFLENNPSGQFGWIEGRTGQPLTAALAEMLVAGRPVG